MTEIICRKQDRMKIVLESLKKPIIIFIVCFVHS